MVSGVSLELSSKLSRESVGKNALGIPNDLIGVKQFSWAKVERSSAPTRWLLPRPR